MRKIVGAVATMALAGCGVAFLDISPNSTSSQQQHSSGPSGVVYGIYGDESALYALTPSAGVWKSTSGGPWAQLSASPRYAISMAIDPTNPAHLAVGERDGDAKAFNLERTGLWESSDGGATFTLTFQPITQPGCRAAGVVSIPALAFTSDGTLYVGTPCGIGRRAPNQRSVDFSTSPAGAGLIAAFANSISANGDELLWALEDKPNSNTIYSLDVQVGPTWAGTPVPPTSPEGLGFQPLIQGARGDAFSLAAVGDTALILYPVQGGTNPSLLSSLGNSNVLLYFDRTQKNWKWKTQITFGFNNGTGPGGRRSVRSFIINRPDLAPTVGQRYRVFLDGGQGVLSADGPNPDGTFHWAETPLVNANCSSCAHPDGVHADVWDVHATAAVGGGNLLGLDSRVNIRVATDGGIYRQKFEQTSPTLIQRLWVTQNDGLHNHHVHWLSLSQDQPAPRLAYATVDNDAWFRGPVAVTTPVGGWATYNMLGDANWTAADAGNPALALLVTNPHGFTELTDYFLPVAGAQHVGNKGFSPLCVITTDMNGKSSCSGGPPIFGPRSLNFIQTPKGVTAPSLLDAVLLIDLPLTYISNGQPQTVNPGSTGRTLLRDPAWATHPDINDSRAQFWTAVGPAPPQTPQAMWVSGGHNTPTYYVTVLDSSNAISVWKLQGALTQWQQLTNIGSPLLDIYSLWVNPWDPNHLIVATQAGIKVSTIVPKSRDLVFVDDPVLTALVTDSGKYPGDLIIDNNVLGNLCNSGNHCYNGGNNYLPNFPGGDSSYLPVGRARALAALCDVEFDRDVPHQVAVSSPFTGVFYATDDQRQWRSLAAALPKPFTPTCSLGIDNTSLYVAMEGRSIGRLSPFGNAPLACYYKAGIATANDPLLLAQALRSDGKNIAGAVIETILVSPTDGAEAKLNLTTDAQGNLRYAPRIRLSGPVSIDNGTVVHLSYKGDGSTAACTTSFVYNHP
jgi:hypothetical protein